MEPLLSSEILTQLLHSKNISTWPETLVYIKNLPYGRNTSRADFSLVIKEEKGTCSSKHAFLKQVALENEIKDIELIVGIYKMTPTNTPGIGNHIQNSKLDYIPEAHCYLKINGKRVDVTASISEIQKIENTILFEVLIQPNQVIDWKVKFHKQFIKEWVISEKIPYTFLEVWKIRELCINELSIY